MSRVQAVRDIQFVFIIDSLVHIAIADAVCGDAEHKAVHTSLESVGHFLKRIELQDFKRIYRRVGVVVVVDRQTRQTKPTHLLLIQHC